MELLLVTKIQELILETGTSNLGYWEVHVVRTMSAVKYLTQSFLMLKILGLLNKYHSNSHNRFQYDHSLNRSHCQSDHNHNRCQHQDQDHNWEVVEECWYLLNHIAHPVSSNLFHQNQVRLISRHNNLVDNSSLFNNQVSLSNRNNHQ
jgi:hypothetical protein